MNLLAELQEFRARFFPVASPDKKIQSNWATLSCDHDSREQLTRQKRSIRTLPVYVDHNMRHAYFLSSDMNYIYDVRLFDCTCPDHEKRVLPCKHMYRLFYELTVGTDYTMGVNASNFDSVTGFLELSDEDKLSYKIHNGDATFHNYVIGLIALAVIALDTWSTQEQYGNKAALARAFSSVYGALVLVVIAALFFGGGGKKQDDKP